MFYKAWIKGLICDEIQSILNSDSDKEASFHKNAKISISIKKIWHVLNGIKEADPQTSSLTTETRHIFLRIDWGSLMFDL